MATRYYPSTKSVRAFHHGPLLGQWSSGVTEPFSPVRNRWMLLRTKQSLPLLTTYLGTNQQGNYDYCTDWTWSTPPLQAQTISGTLDCCFQYNMAWLTDEGSGSAFYDNVAKLKLHVYVASGNTVQHKATLLDNYIGVDIPNNGLAAWTQLTIPAPLTPVTVAAGDVIVVEIGVRIVSAHGSTPTYPVSEWLRIMFHSMRARDIYPDATPAQNGYLAYSPWFEFSANILELPEDTTAPANDSCSEALVIPSLPYTSAFIDSTYSTDTKRAIWWKYTATKTGELKAFTHGTATPVVLNVYTGICGALLFQENYFFTKYTISGGRSFSGGKINVEAGVTYYFKISDTDATTGSGTGGGMVRFIVIEPRDIQTDDLVIPGTTVQVFREGQLVTVNIGMYSYNITGIAFDYTKRPMVDQRDGSIHSDVRLLIGSHDYELVGIVDANTMNEGESETDYIGDAANWAIYTPGAYLHTGQLYVTAAGMLYTGWFGNGYLFVGGRTSQGNDAMITLNAPSNVPAYTSIKSIDATFGDEQPGGPFPDTEHLAATSLSLWAFTMDETTGIIYYSTDGFYHPSTQLVVKRYNVYTNTQLADFATLPAKGLVTGLKGMRLLPDGGLLVCNGNVVDRLNSSGALIQTYVPSIPMDSTQLVDLALTADKTKFWVIDLQSTRVFKFDVATGANLGSFQTYSNPTGISQIQVYSNTPPPPPDPSGIYFINPQKATVRDTYYVAGDKKIPNPTVKTALLGE